MRDKLRLSDLSILFVCLSRDWGTIERRCLADASYFRNMSGTSFILCHPKSLIDEEAEGEDIPRIYFSSDLSSWRSKINFYFQLQIILREQQIDLIHSYNYESLVPLGMILQGMPQVPMIFSFNENIAEKKSSFIDKWFVSRTDAIFTFSPNIRELAIESFFISFRKVHVTGLGIDFPPMLKLTHRTEHLKKMMTFIPRNETKLDCIRILVDSISPLLYQLEQMGLNEQIRLTFITDIPWYDHPLYDSLKRMILERHLEMNINFETRGLKSTCFQDCDIFLGLPHNELFSDLDLYALITQTPVLLPRTSTRQQAIMQGRLGETYHPEDGRELKDKIIKIITHYPKYLAELEGAVHELQDQHHYERYSEDLYNHYERLYSQRLRYALKKKKIA